MFALGTLSGNVAWTFIVSFALVLLSLIMGQILKKDPIGAVFLSSLLYAAVVTILTLMTCDYVFFTLGFLSGIFHVGVMLKYADSVSEAESTVEFLILLLRPLILVVAMGVVLILLVAKTSFVTVLVDILLILQDDVDNRVTR